MLLLNSVWVWAHSASGMILTIRPKRLVFISEWIALYLGSWSYKGGTVSGCRFDTGNFCVLCFGFHRPPTGCGDWSEKLMLCLTDAWLIYWLSLDIGIPGVMLTI